MRAAPASGASHRLAELLSAEDDMYSQLLEETFESAAQRKERLFSKAKALRAAREQKRREFVAKITEERWRCVLIVLIVSPAAVRVRRPHSRVCASVRAPMTSAPWIHKPSLSAAPKSALLSWRKPRQRA